MLELDSADSRPLYSQIMDEIRRNVVLGVWAADEPLPSVRQMASELRVNPNTVQQAYRELEREGVVYVLRGQGTFVSVGAGRSQRAPLLRAFAQRIAREAYRSGFTTSDLMEALQELGPEETFDREDAT
ncbi:MAG: GntR family transcriptional regulator [Longimicrobiales bacterium]